MWANSGSAYCKLPAGNDILGVFAVLLTSDSPSACTGLPPTHSPQIMWAVPRTSICFATSLHAILFDKCATLGCFHAVQGSGLSEGKYVTLGALEADDVEVIVQHLRSTGTVSTLGLWGRSMVGCWLGCYSLVHMCCYCTTLSQLVCSCVQQQQHRHQQQHQQPHKHVLWVCLPTHICKL